MKKIFILAATLIGLNLASFAQAAPAQKKEVKKEAKVVHMNKATPTAKVAPATKPAPAPSAAKKEVKAAPATAASAPGHVKTGTSAASVAPGHLKKDGTPDKRFKENQHLKKDGTPDMRYKENKAKK
jgi:hypothetical protein